jgi:hypothetical protein
LEAEPSAGLTPTSHGERPKQFSLGVADFVETESFAEAEPERVSRRPGRVGAASARGPSAGGSTARGAFGSGLGAGASAAGASSASDAWAGAAAAGELSLSPTRQRLLREETHPQMVVVRVLEDAKWAQGRLKREALKARAAGARISSLKAFWDIRTEVVKVLQGLGVLPHELFFAEEESDFDHLPTGVVETIAGLLAGRLEPQPTADGDHAA